MVMLQCNFEMMVVNGKGERNVKNKVTSLLLTLTLVAGLLGGIALQGSKSSAAIYFAGEYRKSDGVVLTLNKYSSPEGKNVGNFQIDIPHVYDAYDGELIKIGNNKYRSKKKGLTFKVYKKKVVLKVSGSRYDKALKGTYKLKKHFYS